MIIIDGKKAAATLREELKKKISNIDILVPCIGDTIDASIIKSATKLKMIANYANGVDNIDLVTAEEKKIVVTNTPEVLTNDTADIVISLILMLCRSIPKAQQLLSDGTWSGWGPNKTLGQSINGTLSSVGLFVLFGSFRSFKASLNDSPFRNSETTLKKFIKFFKKMVEKEFQEIKKFF